MMIVDLSLKTRLSIKELSGVCLAPSKETSVHVPVLQ